VVVVYENTRYRDPRRALDRAAELLLPEVHSSQELILVPTLAAVPIVSARYAGQTSQDDLSPSKPPVVALDVSDLPPDLLRARRESSSFGRIDIVVHPWFEASFGNHLNLVASRTGVAPEIHLVLLKGFTVSAQALITIQDDLPTGESWLRPGHVTVNQTLRLPHNVFVFGRAGTLGANRYGADVEGRVYGNDGRWSVGADLGVSGVANYSREHWKLAPAREMTALTDVTMRTARYDLSFRATVGQFLPGERGVRVDVARQFGEFEVGWFAVKTETRVNGGLTLRIPLQPAKYGRPAPIRMRIADEFEWQYRYRGFISAGRKLDAGNTMDWPIRQLTP